MSQDVFQGYPEEWGQKEDQLGKGLRDFREDETEKSPVESKKKNKYDVNNDAYSQRKIAVVGRNRWDPVNQDRVVGDSGYKPQEERLGWLFIDDDE
jgi:hypothetical protein